jgi:DNA (cytosine-5)-methyltransferase 1
MIAAEKPKGNHLVAVPSELNLISLCTGGGALDLGVGLAIPSARPVCYLEREAFAVAHLVEAMQKGLMAQAPIWSDVRTFDGRPWRGLVAGIIGGIPCQPHSVSGKRRAELDERDLWSSARRIIVQSRPWFVLIENVAGMVSSGGAERIWRELRRLGFEVEGGLFTASELGASQERKRLFILGVAHRGGHRWQGSDLIEPAAQPSGLITHANPGGRGEAMADRGGERGRPGFSAPARGHGLNLESGLAHHDCDDLVVACRARTQEMGVAEGEGRQQLAICRPGADKGNPDLERPSAFPPGPDDLDAWRDIIERSPGLEPAVRRVAHGLAYRVDKLRLLGNGVVPLVAAYALKTLSHRLAARGATGAAFLADLIERAD